MRLVGARNVCSGLCILLIASLMMIANSCDSDHMPRPKAQLLRGSESILTAHKSSLSVGNTPHVLQMTQKLEYIL